MLKQHLLALFWGGLLMVGSVTGQTLRPAGVRYQVKDVERSVAFYTQHLGFKLVQQPAPAFASVCR